MPISVLYTEWVSMINKGKLLMLVVLVERKKYTDKMRTKYADSHIHRLLSVQTYVRKMEQTEQMHHICRYICQQVKSVWQIVWLIHLVHVQLASHTITCGCRQKKKKLAWHSLGYSNAGTWYIRGDRCPLLRFIDRQPYAATRPLRPWYFHQSNGMRQFFLLPIGGRHRCRCGLFKRLHLTPITVSAANKIIRNAV